MLNGVPWWFVEGEPLRSVDPIGTIGAALPFDQIVGCVVHASCFRPSPDRIQDADEAYLMQMAVYVAVLRAVFPGRAVEAALVWTDGPKLMAVPESLIAAALERLGQAG